MSISMREVFTFQGTSGAIGSFRQLLATLPFGVTIGLREIHRRLMGPEILREYFPDGLLETLGAVKAGLQSVIQSSIPTQIDQVLIDGRQDSPRPLPENAQAISINRDRNDLFHFLQTSDEVRKSLVTAYEQFAKREFSLREIDKIEHSIRDTDVSPITKQTIISALTRTNIPYTYVYIDHHPSTGARIGRPYDVTLSGHAGPDLNNYQIAQLLDFHEFLSRGPEYDYRMGLLRAECHLGGGDLEQAIGSYQTLLQTTLSHDHGRHRLRRELVTLRLGFAHLAFGDQLYRRVRRDNGNTLDEAKRQYEAARQVMEGAQISPGDPRRQQIERYAAVQMDKLAAGLNFIGYRDSYVPILKPEVLQGLAERRIARATEAIGKFELFKSKADQIRDQLADLDFEGEIKAIDNEIAAQRVANANDQKRIADKRVAQIHAQLDALDTSLFVDLGSALLQGVAAGFLAGRPDGIDVATGTNTLGVAGAVGGIASTVAGYFARKDDLQAQKKIAEIESGLAARDVEIAELERQIIGRTLEFLGDKIERIQKRELNPELYYAAAEDFRILAERHLDAAIALAYLFERAVAFLRLEPKLQKIQFDYMPLVQEDHQGNLLTAADRLEADLEDVVGKNLPITKFQLLTETYSLRLFYPIEFSRFLQTGEMDFTLSLYELNKRRPGVWRQRIKHIDVEVRGLIPITGYTGRIIHRGSFLLRDKDTTPEPGAGRFIPTENDLADEFQRLKNGATQGVPIAGVMPFLLDEDRLELSPDQPPPNLGDPAPEALRPIEGYGPAGDWRLEIENMDLRLITDVLLRVTYVLPESDGALSSRVKGLIATYEQQDLSTEGEDRLDLITPFSLRQQFPDTFSQLVGGQASLALRRQDFPSRKIADLKLKTVVAQALDRQKQGVEGLALGITRPGTPLDLARTTRADGFSEDVTVPLPVLPRDERFPVEGTYTLRLPDPGQAGRLDDLLLFFLYEFREV